jgi:hypothetical protein
VGEPGAGSRVEVEDGEVRPVRVGAVEKGMQLERA